MCPFMGIFEIFSLLIIQDLHIITSSHSLSYSSLISLIFFFTKIELLKILIKISNVVGYFELNTQNTELPRTNDHIIYYRLELIIILFIEGALETIKFSTSINIHIIDGWLDLLFKALRQERKRRKQRIYVRVLWAP